MEEILDLHIHSRFSRACSKDLTIENLDRVVRIKGVTIIGTGDFTHPAWFRELKRDLIETKNNSGLYRYKNSIDDKINFILSAEVSLVYKEQDKVRRVHLVVHAPNFAAAGELNRQLGLSYNIKSDGRPILGLAADKFVELCLKIDQDFIVYPAHIWTPWFSIFGSKSGFNSFAECFKEQTPFIYAYETGLSSDPGMNWRVAGLDKLTLLSSSDAHSLANIGREATVFELKEKTFKEIKRIIKEHDWSAQKYTLEFYPEEGMYHFDGHRDCGVSLSPMEARKNNYLCPVCKKNLTVGVLSRVEELATRKNDFILSGAPKFKKIIELDKIIAQAVGVKSRKSRKVQEKYFDLINIFDNEFNVLLNIDRKSLEAVAGEKIAQGIIAVREGKVKITPGFDGRYGELKIFS